MHIWLKKQTKNMEDFIFFLLYEQVNVIPDQIHVEIIQKILGLKHFWVCLQTLFKMVLTILRIARDDENELRQNFIKTSFHS